MLVESQYRAEDEALVRLEAAALAEQLIDVELCFVGRVRIDHERSRDDQNERDTRIHREGGAHSRVLRT